MICEKCGKEHDGSFGSGRFCSRKCANSRKHSEEVKYKIRDSLINFYKDKPKKIKEVKQKSPEKKISAEYPYDSYWLYIVHHSKENRKYAVLISKDNLSKRTTLSYARYLMSVKLGRILLKEEQVDHIDNDKTNDVIENLQLLSIAENNIKQALFKGINYVKLLCPVCRKEFVKRRNRTHLVKRSSVTFCSKECLYQYNSMKAKHKYDEYIDYGLKHNVIEEYIQH